jgi:hypothetical protein
VNGIKYDTYHGFLEIVMFRGVCEAKAEIKENDTAGKRTIRGRREKNL